MSGYGYAPLPPGTFVEGFGTEVCFEVYHIEDGAPAAIVAFTGTEAVAITLVKALRGEAP